MKLVSIVEAGNRCTGRRGKLPMLKLVRWTSPRKCVLTPVPQPCLHPHGGQGAETLFSSI